MSYKSKKAQGLSLIFKEEFELSKLFISSYADNKININNINYDFPICIFGQKIFELGLKNLYLLQNLLHMVLFITILQKMLILKHFNP